MRHKIINRYDHTQIIQEFAELTNIYLIHNEHKVSHKILIKKLVISLIIICILGFTLLKRQLVSQSMSFRVFFVIILLAVVIIYKRIDVNRGMLIGEYSFKNQYVVYEILFVPLTNRCILKETKSNKIRQSQFNYNDYVDQSGNITEKSFLDLVQSFINIQTQVLIQEY